MKNKYPSDSERKFKQSDTANFKQSESKLYNVVFRENRSFEMVVGQDHIRFEAHTLNPVCPEKYRKGVPAEIINHKDFAPMKKYFNITEVM